MEWQASLDRLRNGLTAISGGSTAQGANELAYLREQADKLGQVLESTSGSYLSFAAATKGTALEGAEARRIFESVSKAMLVLGKDSYAVQGALTALQQMISKGTVQSEELKGQLGERLPGAFQLSADAIGRTTDELADMLKNGEVLATDLLPKLATLLEEKYGKGVEAASNSASAALNRNKNAWNELKQAVADAGLADFVKEQMSILTDAMQNVTDKIRKAKEEGKGFWGQMAAGAAGVAQFANPLNAFGYQQQTFSIEETLKRLEDQKKAVQKSGNYFTAAENIRYLDREIEKTKKLIDEKKKIAGYREMAEEESIRLAARSRYQTEIEARQRQAEKEGAKFYEKNRSMAEKYNDELKEAKRLYDLGGLSAEKYKSVVDELNRKLNKAEAGPKTRDPYIADYKALRERVLAQEALVQKLEKTKGIQKELTDTEVFYKKNLESLTAAEKAAIDAKVDHEIAQAKKTKSSKEELDELTKLLAGYEEQEVLLKREIDYLEAVRQARAQRIAGMTQETAAIYQKIQADQDEMDLSRKMIASQQELQLARLKAGQQQDFFGNERLNSIQEEIILAGDLTTAVLELALARAQHRKEVAMFGQDNEAEIDELNRQIAGIERQLMQSRERDVVNAEKRIGEARLNQYKSTTDQIRQIGVAGFEAMLSSGSGKFSSWLDGLKDMFRKRLAEKLYEQFAEPFIVNVVANLVGVNGQDNAQGVISSLFGGGGSGGTGGMNLGSILNIGKTLWSGFSNGFSGFASQIGSIINTIGSKTGIQSIADFGAGFRGGFSTQGVGGSVGWGGKIASSLPWVAAIATGMKLSGQAYDQGYRLTDDSFGGGAFGKVSKWASDAFTGEWTLNKILGERVTGILTGSPLTAKILDRIAGRGGPKAGGSFGLDVSSSGIISTGTLGRMFTPSDSDQSLSEITENLTKSFIDAMKALGGSASGAQFALGFDVDPKGKAQTRISSLTKVGGQDALVSFDREIGKGTDNLGAELEAETRKMLIAALKSSSLPDGVSQIIAKGIPDAVAASKEDIEKTLTDAAFWKVTFVDGAERIARQFGEKISYEAFSKLLEEGESLQSGISRISDVFDATNLVAVALGRDMNKAFGQIGLASFDARQQLINFAGGIQNLVAGTSAYYDNFFTDAEKAANITKQLTDEFGKYGLALPASRAEFRKLVESLDLTAEGGRKAYAELIGVAGAFDEMTKVAEESAKEAADAAKKAEEEAKKATEEAAKLMEEAAKRAADAIKLVGEIMDETARIGMTDYQRALADIDKTYRDHVQSLTDLGAATTENVAAAEALRKAQLTALEADRTKQAADGIAVFTKELARMDWSELDTGLADINDRYAEQMRVLLELDRATVANVSALDAWKRAMINAALTTSAVASGRRLVELQGGSLAGVDTALAEQGYSAALGGLAAEFGVTVGQVRDYLKQTGQSIEGVALQYWSSLNDAQRRAVIIASDAKAAYIEALRAQFDAQTEMVQKYAADLSSVRALGASIDQDIANLRVELGQTTREAVIAEQMAQIAREWQSNWTLKTIEEQVAAGEKYRSLIIERYQIEVENATKLKQFAFSLGDYLKGLRVGNLSNLSLESRMLEARRQFEETRAAAAGGDERAQQKLTSSADTLLQLGREYYASSMGYTELFTFVTGSLEGLGAESATEAEKQLEVSNAQKAAAEKAVSELAYLRIGVNNAEKVVVSRLDTAIAEFKRLADKLLEEGAQNPVVAAINALPVAIRQQLAGLIPGAGITPTTPTPTAEKSYNINGQAFSSGALRIIAQPMLQNQDWTGIYNMAKSAGLRLSDINDILGQPAGTAEDVARRLGLPMFADGGVVTGPTMGLIGERGPEAIIPLADWSRYGRDPELIAEIRALRAEVSDLKREAARTASAAEAQIVQAGAQHVEVMAVANEQLRTDRDTNAEVKRMADRR